MATTSLPLFDTRLASHTHVRPSKNETWARILEYAENCGRRGFTADELAAAWGCSHNHVAPRISELAAGGDLILSGERRPTRSGCLARVFIAAKFAHPAKDVTASHADSLFGSLSLGRHPD